MGKNKLTWSQKLASARQLREKAGGILYERLMLLKDVASDPDYREDCRVRDVNPEDEMDYEVSDTCASFHVLLLTLERFPERTIWERNLVKQLVAKVIDESQGTGKSYQEKRVSWKARAMEAQKEIERLSRELELAKAKIETLEKILPMAAA